jgi:hypothetical protein
MSPGVLDSAGCAGSADGRAALPAVVSAAAVPPTFWPPDRPAWAPAAAVSARRPVPDSDLRRVVGRLYSRMSAARAYNPWAAFVTACRAGGPGRPGPRGARDPSLPKM